MTTTTVTHTTLDSVQFCMWSRWHSYHMAMKTGKEDLSWWKCDEVCRCRWWESSRTFWRADLEIQPRLTVLHQNTARSMLPASRFSSESNDVWRWWWSHVCFRVKYILNIWTTTAKKIRVVLSYLDMELMKDGVTEGRRNHEPATVPMSVGDTKLDGERGVDSREIYLQEYISLREPH